MPFNVEIDARELIQLSVELGEAGLRVEGPVRDAFRDGAYELRDEWKKNAKASSGRHARKYASSITAREWRSRDLNFAIGPVKSPKGSGRQGSLGGILEFGVPSKNTAPALAGQKAADLLIPLIERRILLAAEDVFGRA